MLPPTNNRWPRTMLVITCLLTACWRKFKKKLSLGLKTRVSVVVLRSVSSWFQTRGPATEKIIVLLHVGPNAAHGMSCCPSVRSSFRPFVRLSVCTSLKRVICDKTKEICAHILIPHERSFILVFWQEEWLTGATPCTWNFGSNWPCWSENADFRSIFARSAQP